MLERYHHNQSEIPTRLGDASMNVFARELLETADYYLRASKEMREIIWPACDRAFMCLRRIPGSLKQKLIYQGAIGESDAWEAVHTNVEAMLLGIMPPDESWLTAASVNEEDDAILAKISAYQAYLHHNAKTRHQYGKHLTQMMIRGTSAIGARWKVAEKLRRLGTNKSRRVLEKLGKDLTGESQGTSRIREAYTAFNGPIVTPIDMYNLLLDPAADLAADHDVPSVHLVHKSIDDLQDAVDEDGKKVYSNLDGLDTWSPLEIYNHNRFKYDSIKNLGISQDAEPVMGNLVPVYIFHRFIQKFKGEKWIDTLFYVALDKKEGNGRLIRIQENPSDMGHKPFFVDTYHDWLNCAYGIGAVEKSLAAIDAKNLISGLLLNAQTAMTFPAVTVIGGLMKDDKKPRLGPMEVNEISWKANIGVDFIKPIQLPYEGIVVGIQNQQLQGAKIMSQMGSLGSGAYTDPNKSIAAEKTATQVRQETTNSLAGKENQIEKFIISSLQPLAQVVYDYSRQYADSPQIPYVARDISGDVRGAKITRRELNQERSIEIVGRRGLSNKAHEIANLIEALKTLLTGGIDAILPNAPLIIQDIMWKLLPKLGIIIKPEYKLTPVQLAMQDPAAIIEMLQKAASDPAGIAILSTLFNGGQLPNAQQQGPAPSQAKLPSGNNAGAGSRPPGA